MDDINVNLSRNIVFLRKNGKLTQLELGKMLNVSDKAISRWERGEALPDISNLVDISTLFSVSVDSLLKDNLQQSFSLNKIVDDADEISTQEDKTIVLDMQEQEDSNKNQNNQILKNELDSNKINQEQKRRHFSTTFLVCVSFILLGVITCIYSLLIAGVFAINALVYVLPAMLLFIILFNKKFLNDKYKKLLWSIFLWICLVCVYLYMIEYNIWLIFIIGFLLQLAINVFFSASNK